MSAADALSTIATWAASLYGIATLTAVSLVVGVIISRSRK